MVLEYLVRVMGGRVSGHGGSRRSSIINSHRSRHLMVDLVVMVSRVMVVRMLIWIVLKVMVMMTQ